MVTTPPEEPQPEQPKPLILDGIVYLDSYTPGEPKQDGPGDPIPFMSWGDVYREDG